MNKLLLLVMAVMLVGCGATGATGVSRTVKVNNVNMAKLNVGMTKAQVLATMGSAGRTEAYVTNTGGVLEFLFYRTEHTRVHVIGGEELGTVTDRHWTPVCIIDGKLKGWGRNFYDTTIKIRKEIIKNP